MTDDHPSILDRTIPADVAERLQTAFGLEARPDTLGEWTDRTARRLNAADWTLTPADLCRVEEGAVRAVAGNEEFAFRCIFDAFLLPHLHRPETRIDVRAETPVHSRPIALTIDRGSATADPTEAVMSIGTTAAVLPPEAGSSFELAYASFCPYINPFVDVAEYERWAATTPEARTMSVPLESGPAIAAGLVDGVDRSRGEGGEHA